MAVGILGQARAAQTAVSQRDSAAAIDHIRQGQALDSEILRAMASHPGPVLVEVRRQIQTTTTYVDVKHNHGEMSADRLKKNTTIAEVEQQGTASMLDVSSAGRHLDNALSAVQNGNWDLASSELAAIPQSVIQTRIDGDVPLLRAQQNLELARARILEGHPHDAAGPLRAAAQALTDFSRLFPGPHTVDAGYMQQQMLASAENVASGDTVDRINVLWLPEVIRWQKEGGAKSVQ